MNLGNIEIDEQKIRDAAMDAAFQVAKKEAEKAFQHDCFREKPRYDSICRFVDEVIDNLLASPEFKAKVASICEEEFLMLAKEKIANAVARTSVAKLRGE